MFSGDSRYDTTGKYVVQIRMMFVSRDEHYCCDIVLLISQKLQHLSKNYFKRVYFDHHYLQTV